VIDAAQSDRLICACSVAKRPTAGAIQRLRLAGKRNDGWASGQKRGFDRAFQYNKCAFQVRSGVGWLRSSDCVEFLLFTCAMLPRLEPQLKGTPHERIPTLLFDTSINQIYVRQLMCKCVCEEVHRFAPATHANRRHYCTDTLSLHNIVLHFALTPFFIAAHGVSMRACNTSITIVSRRGDRETSDFGACAAGTRRILAHCSSSDGHLSTAPFCFRLLVHHVVAHVQQAGRIGRREHS
jgi:hypothetical protein